MTLVTTLTKQYIEKQDKGYWIEGTRISLDSVVYCFVTTPDADATHTARASQQHHLLVRL